jgi:uncharacterized protein (TIGR02270 family)
MDMFLRTLLGAPAVLPDVLAEHLDEAEFLWEQWEQALVAPDFDLEGVATGPEARLLTHLAALAAAPREPLAGLLAPALVDTDSRARACAAASAWLLAPGDAGLDAVLAALAGAAPVAPAVVASPRDDLDTHLFRIVTRGGRPSLAFERVLVARGIPPAEPRLRAWLAADDPTTRALGVAGVRLSTTPLAYTEGLSAAMGADEPDLRGQALAVGLWARHPTASRELWRAAVEVPDDLNLVLLALWGSPAEHGPIFTALDRPGCERAAIWALGFAGTRRASEACLARLAQPGLRRIASEAIAAITGVDPETLRDPADDEDEDDGLADAPERWLVRMDPARTVEWWSGAAASFGPAGRWIAGAPHSAAAVRAALVTGPMRRRPLLALGPEFAGAPPPRCTTTFAHLQLRGSPG